MSSPQPPTHPNSKPPKRHWNATEPFFDMRASHWVEVVLTFTLLLVGASQLFVYHRQASIMETQASIATTQLAFQEGVSRAWIKAHISLSRPILFTDWANDKFINISLKFDMTNTGPVPATNIRILTQITPRGGGSDRNTRLSKMQSTVCEQVRELANSDKIGGTAAFPNESKSVETGSGSVDSTEMETRVLSQFLGALTIPTPTIDMVKLDSEKLSGEL